MSSGWYVAAWFVTITASSVLYEAGQWETATILLLLSPLVAVAGAPSEGGEDG